MVFRILVFLAFDFICLPALSFVNNQSLSYQTIQTESPILSPRLIRLQQELGKGDSNAVLEAFWKEISRQGTPFVEPIETSEQYVFVTFLWQGNSETKNVVILTLGNSQLGNAEYFPAAQMSHLSSSDVWFKTYRLRNDARFSYRIGANDSLELLKDFSLDPKRGAAFKADPLNTIHYTGIYGDSSVVELAKAPPQIWNKPMPGVSEGKVEKLPFKSRILNNERDIWVYTPPDYPNSKTAYNLLVTLDGSKYATTLPAPIILNNLIGKGKLAPTIAVMIGNADGARGKELFYDEQFAEFCARELMPWVRQNYRVTNKATKTFLAGSSLSAGTVAFLALRHPELFGNVIAQSGGFMYRQNRDRSFQPRVAGELFEENFPESEWVVREFAGHPKMPINFYLEVGLMEDVIWREWPPRFGYPSLLLATRHFRDVLQAKGYNLCYNEYNGAHEDLSWRGTFADALMLLAENGCAAESTR